jgi:RimJ/RimL family protein N-acetyltransferase
MTLVLRGVEVTLRPLSVDDVEALAAALAESREHYGFSEIPEGLEETRRYVEKALGQQAAEQRIPFTIVWCGRVVGTTSYYDFQPWEWPVGCDLQRRDRPDTLEIGYTWLAVSAQRTRCNTEAKYLLLSQAFDFWEVHRVCLRTDVRNERSRRAIERLGAHFEGVRRADMPGQDCTVRDSAFYSIVSAEWPQLQNRLREILES